MVFRSFASALALMALAGCGGGGDSGGGGGPITSTPTPSPAPAPSPTYDEPLDFTADFSWALLTAEVERSGDISTGTFVFETEARNLDGTANANRIAWDAGAETIKFDFQNDSFVFTGAELETVLTDGRRWTARDLTPYFVDSLTVTDPVNQPTGDIEYIIDVRQDREFDTTDGTNKRVFSDVFALGGSFTVTSDIPGSGTKTYSTGALSSSPTPGSGTGFVVEAPPGSTERRADVTFDFSGTNFSATIPLIQINGTGANPPASFTAELSGTFDPAENRITGTIASPNSDYNGTFAGAFFGPAGEELGIVWVVGNPSEAGVTGYFYGDST